jgi:ring-1,2-phenylacetyl-CoA epoxidase subunit PaaD
VNAAALPEDATRSAAQTRIAAAWRTLAEVEDPEIPALSVVDLGIVRFVEAQPDGALEIGLSPTYTGCPATEVIRRAVEGALVEAGVGPIRVRHVLSPAWSSDWISAEGRRKLAAYGIVPPPDAVASMRQLLRGDRPVACPRCDSPDTECTSQFGSTPCKALHRCRQCLEPFETFKCI